MCFPINLNHCNISIICKYSMLEWKCWLIPSSHTTTIYVQYGQKMVLIQHKRVISNGDHDFLVQRKSFWEILTYKAQADAYFEHSLEIVCNFVIRETLILISYTIQYNQHAYWDLAIANRSSFIHNRALRPYFKTLSTYCPLLCWRAIS